MPEIHLEWMFVCDRNNFIVSVSQSVLDCCSLKVDEITGKRFDHVIEKCFGEYSGDWKDLASTVESGQSHESRLEFRHTDGLKKVFEFVSSPMMSGIDHAPFTAITLKDITEHARIEEILERYAEGLTVLYEISNAFLSESSMEDVLTEVLGMIRTYYDADLVQVLTPVGNGGTSMLELMAVSGSGADVGSRVPLHEDSIEGGAVVGRCPVVVPDLSTSADFTRAEFMPERGIQSGIGVPMMVEDNAFGVLSILYFDKRQIDTAELWYLNVLANTLAVFIEKEQSMSRLAGSERFLSSVLEGIGEGVVVFDPELTILSANKGYLDTVGLGVNDVVGKRFHQMSYGDVTASDGFGDISTVRKVFETGKPQSGMLLHKNKAGGESHVQRKSYPIFGSEGRVVAVVETLMDMTDSIRLEKDLEKRVKELEEFYDMAVGRELRMIELKDEIERLREELSQHRTQ